MSDVYHSDAIASALQRPAMGYSNGRCRNNGSSVWTGKSMAQQIGRLFGGGRVAGGGCGATRRAAGGGGTGQRGRTTHTWAEDIPPRVVPGAPVRQLSLQRE